jgi:hypothetical protein
MLPEAASSGTGCDLTGCFESEDAAEGLIVDRLDFAFAIPVVDLPVFACSGVSDSVGVMLKFRLPLFGRSPELLVYRVVVVVALEIPCGVDTLRWLYGAYTFDERHPAVISEVTARTGRTFFHVMPFAARYLTLS